MSPKDFFSTPEEALLYKKAPQPKGPAQKARGRRPLPSSTAVRAGNEIPQSLLDYFQFNTRQRHPLTLEERTLHAQVYLHEIEEGARLLSRAHQEKEAQILADFANNLHPSQRLEMLRKRLEETRLLQSSPERIRHAYKARGNQWGAVKAQLGPHPAVAFTELGVGYKEVNEDAFLLMPQHKVMALADGLGGHPGGGVASTVAIDFFEYGVSQGISLGEAIVLANDAMRLRSQSDPLLGGMYPMACTFAAVQLKHDELRVAYVGDTKVMVLREGKIIFESKDHTKGQDLLRDRLVDYTTAFELNHLLSRCLGLDILQAWRDVSVHQIFLEPGDRVLVLTDGITDNFYDGRFSLEPLVPLVEKGPLAHGADLLVEACHRRMNSTHLPDGRSSKPDNISLAMLEYRG